MVAFLDDLRGSQQCTQARSCFFENASDTCLASHYLQNQSLLTYSCQVLSPPINTACPHNRSHENQLPVQLLVRNVAGQWVGTDCGAGDDSWGGRVHH